MSQSSSTDRSLSSVAPDAISRRAYELWESEGRPEGSDLRHWLQAEQELEINRVDNGRLPTAGAALRHEDREAFRYPGTDARPLQGTRAAAAASREPKRGSTNPFGDRAASGTGNGQSTGKRKPTNTPPM
jgi:hypothetical protein